MRGLTIVLCFACLARAEKMESKIVGGQLASISRFPHAVFIHFTFEGIHDDEEIMYTTSCGSSILTQRVLLTACHCIHGETDQDRMVSIGATAASEHRQRNGNHHRVTAVIGHPDYDVETFENDIALLRPKPDIKLGQKSKRVAVLRYTPQTSNVYVAGWGITNEETRAKAMYLKATKQVVVNFHECGKVLSGNDPRKTICADSPRQKQEFGFASSGDSGSALIADEYIQIGIVSFKRPDQSVSLVVYTNVSRFYNWIKLASESIHCHGK